MMSGCVCHLGLGFFSLPYFCVAFSRIQLFIWFPQCSPYWLVDISFVILDCSVLSILFGLVSVSFKSSFFRFNFFFFFGQLKLFFCPVGWSCRIHRLHLCRGVIPPNEYPGYDTKQSDGEVAAVLDLWEIRNTPSLPLLQGPLWPTVVAADRALSMG